MSLTISYAMLSILFTIKNMSKKKSSTAEYVMKMFQEGTIWKVMLLMEKIKM